jgi:hypothetical protein
MMLPHPLPGDHHGQSDLHPFTSNRNHPPQLRYLRRSTAIRSKRWKGNCRPRLRHMRGSRADNYRIPTAHRGRTSGVVPRGNNKHRMELCGLSKARPISCCDCPAFHRHHMSLFSIAESPNRFPGLMQHHLYRADLYQMVSHRPIETAFIRHLPGLTLISRCKPRGFVDLPQGRNLR